MKIEVNQKQLNLLDKIVHQAISDAQYILYTDTPEAIKKFESGLLDDLQDLQCKILAKQGDQNYKYWN